MKTTRTHRFRIPNACILALLLAFGGCAVDEEAEVSEVETQEVEPLGAEDDLEPMPMEPGAPEPMEPGEPATPMGSDVEEPAAEPSPAEPAPASPGEEVFAARCGTCHETADLAGVGDRFDRTALEAFLRKQEAVDGEEHQIAFRGSPEEMKTLLDWLLE